MKIKIGDITKIRTGKLDANASSPDGEYPFFTCSREPLKISSYSYDCECVLVAGNGDLNVKYYKGKFDAYQRTYIIEHNGNRKLFIPFLYYYMENYLQELRQLSIGGVIKYIKLCNLTDAVIDLPNIETQKRITGILDSVRDIQAARQKQLRALDELVKARFIEMFGDIHNSKKYPYKAVQTFTKVTSGGTPNRNTPEYWENGTIPWVKTTELQNNILCRTEEYITEKGLNESSAKIVPADTILIAMYGQGKTRGMTAYLQNEAATNQACACIYPSIEVDQKYLWCYFILSYEKLRSMAEGGNQPNLNGNMIKSFPVLLPPKYLQTLFVSFLDQTNHLKSKLRESLTQTETLFNSLMQQYFG